MRCVKTNGCVCVICTILTSFGAAQQNRIIYGQQYRPYPPFPQPWNLGFRSRDRRETAAPATTHIVIDPIIRPYHTSVLYRTYRIYIYIIVSSKAFWVISPIISCGRMLCQVLGCDSQENYYIYTLVHSVFYDSMFLLK